MSSDSKASRRAAAEPKKAAGAHPYSVLHNRDLVLYLTARFVASLGQQMLTLAVMFEIWKRTGSTLALAMVGLTQMAPMLLFTLPAGHAADNHKRKRIIILTTAVLACASVGLTVVSTLQANVLWMYVCLFVAGVARTFLWPASSAFLPSLVSRSDFARAVTWSSGSFQLSSVAGPAACGLLLSIAGPKCVYATNALAAILCLSLVALVRREHKVQVREKMTLTNLIVGFRFVFANRIILATITLDLFAVLLGGATALLPVYATEILHVGPEKLGILVAALPLGSLLCALVLAHRPPMQHAGRSLIWAVAVFGLATVVFGFSHWFPLSFAMMFICGYADNISVVVRHTLVQLLTPDEKRGRVSAVNSLFIGTSNELGGFESGLVADLFGPRHGFGLTTGPIVSVVSGGIGTILVVLGVAALWPELARYGRLDSHEPPSPEPSEPPQAAVLAP